MYWSPFNIPKTSLVLSFAYSDSVSTDSNLSHTSMSMSVPERFPNQISGRENHHAIHSSILAWSSKSGHKKKVLYMDLYIQYLITILTYWAVSTAIIFTILSVGFTYDSGNMNDTSQITKNECSNNSNDNVAGNGNLEKEYTIQDIKLRVNLTDLKFPIYKIETPSSPDETGVPRRAYYLEADNKRGLFVKKFKTIYDSKDPTPIDFVTVQMREDFIKDAINYYRSNGIYMSSRIVTLD